MSDNTELKRLVDRVLTDRRFCGDENHKALADGVLALIAENEELGRYLCTCRDCGGEGALHTGDWHSYGHMEPPEPVMEKCGECDGTGLLGEIQDLYQVITERDRLRAEVAGLRTGYEAYEQINAELKVEIESLRMNSSRYEWLKVNSSVMLKKTASYTTGLGLINTIYPAASELDLAIDAAMRKGSQS